MHDETGSDGELFAEYLGRPKGFGHLPLNSYTGAAGGAACGDLIAISLRVDGEIVADAGFKASGCGATIAAGSAVVSLISGRPLLEVARIGAQTIVDELGGLIPAKRHAAELAADALHRALGQAARVQAALEVSSRRTLVAMSGGVDSSVAVLLSERAGEEVVAVTLELWADPENDGERSCCSAQAVRGAREVAHSLGLPHFTLDLREEFRAGVVQPFIEAHRAGHTPNPCVLCNGHVRLDEMLLFADRLGAAKLATGHYARIEQSDGRRLLRSAIDVGKDQSYMLSALSQESLAKMSFPLGELTKPQVRTLAAEAGLSVAKKPDSQDLCFLAGTNRTKFLRKHGGLDRKPGEIVDLKGEVLGLHDDVYAFTVGQRKGLGIGGGTPLYVLAVDVNTGRVTVGSRTALATKRVKVRDIQFVGSFRNLRQIDRVRLRYRSAPLECVVEGLRSEVGGDIVISLKDPAYGVAPGQVASLLSNETIVGWGKIDF